MSTTAQWMHLLNGLIFVVNPWQQNHVNHTDAHAYFDWVVKKIHFKYTWFYCIDGHRRSGLSVFIRQKKSSIPLARVASSHDHIKTITKTSINDDIVYSCIAVRPFNRTCIRVLSLTSFAPFRTCLSLPHYAFVTRHDTNER